MRATLCSVVLLAAACAHVHPTPAPEERVYDVPLDVALTEAAKLLEANGILVHPVEGQPGVLVSKVTEWDSTKLVDMEPWQRQKIAVMQRSRWLVFGRAVGPHRSSVQIVRQIDNEVTNEPLKPVERPLPDFIKQWSRASPVERLNAEPVRCEPMEQVLAARLDAKAAVEILAPVDEPVVEPEPPPEVPAAPPDSLAVNDCGINSSAIDDFFAAGNTLLLGDQLGTKQAPAAFATLVCTALHHHLEVIAALNLPATQQAALNAYLSTDGGKNARAALIRGSFWNGLYPDGTSSVAMLDLIDQLRRWRQAGAPITVLAIDAPTPGNPREAAMAARIEQQQLKHPNAFSLVLAGNAHVTRHAGAQWDTGLLPLGYRLSSMHPGEVLALDLAFDPGLHWACHLEGKNHLVCGAMAVSPGLQNTENLPVPVRLVRKFSTTSEYGYDGTWYVGRLTASPPAASPDALPPENPGTLEGAGRLR